jgi:hypothetical protein
MSKPRLCLLRFHQAFTFSSMDDKVILWCTLGLDVESLWNPTNRNAFSSMPGLGIISVSFLGLITCADTIHLEDDPLGISMHSD